MQGRLADLLPRLNERDRRLALATEAKSWGRGGITAVHDATGVSRKTIQRGVIELSDDSPEGRSYRVRAPGGGRKKAEITNSELADTLDGLIEPDTRGDPESPLRWTTKSTRHLADALTKMGHSVSHSVVAKLLRARGYSLQGTHKKTEGHQHPDRDDQFRYINKLASEFLASGDPVISVDTKKKELSDSFHRPARNGIHKANPSRCPPIISPTKPTVRPFPTESTTWPTTAPGSPWVSTMTQRSSPSPPSTNGGSAWAKRNIRTPTESSS
jgi:Rhodopirellula transposase DDE domain